MLCVRLCAEIGGLSEIFNSKMVFGMVKVGLANDLWGKCDLNRLANAGRPTLPPLSFSICEHLKGNPQSLVGIRDISE